LSSEQSAQTEAANVVNSQRQAQEPQSAGIAGASYRLRTTDESAYEEAGGLADPSVVSSSQVEVRDVSC